MRYNTASDPPRGRFNLIPRARRPLPEPTLPTGPTEDLLVELLITAHYLDLIESITTHHLPEELYLRSLPPTLHGSPPALNDLERSYNHEKRTLILSLRDSLCPEPIQTRQRACQRANDRLKGRLRASTINATFATLPDHLGTPGPPPQPLTTPTPSGKSNPDPTINPITPTTDTTKNNVINLSEFFHPSKDQTSLLNKGLTFIPTTGLDDPKKQPHLLAETHSYHRRLKLVSFFGDSEDDPQQLPLSKRFVDKSTWEPTHDKIPLPIRTLIRGDRKALRKIPCRPPPLVPNLTQGEAKALRQLRGDKSLVIKPADKGAVTVIQDRNNYVWEATRQLNMPQYYRKLDEPIFPETARKIGAVVNRLKAQRFITSRQSLYLKGKNPPKARHIYFLPKIHKDPDTWPAPHKIPAGRPIVSDIDSETYRVSEYLDYFLNPLSNLHPSYLKDTYDFLEKVRSARVNPGDLIFSMDVDALYTNIEAEAGIRAVRNCFLKHPDESRPDGLLLQLLELALLNNDFDFNGQTYLQIKGVAMGKKFAPALADIYMAEWEETALANCPLKPSHYYRYLDDIWGVWPHSKSQFLEFVDTLNRHHPSISLKYVLEDNAIDFLDTTTFKGPDFPLTKRLDTRVFFKRTDTHALLHANSFHPSHTFRGLVKSQLFRFHRICSRPEDWYKATQTLFRTLKVRGYTRTLLNKAKRSFLQTKPPFQGTLLPIITTFGPRALVANNCLKKRFETLRNTWNGVGNWKPISGYKRNHNLKDMLVRSKLPPLNNLAKRNGGGTRQYYLPRSVIYRNRQTFPTSPDGSVDTTNCVYLLQCYHCGHQYVGETGGSLHTRLTQHLYNVNNDLKPDTALVRHFRQVGTKHIRATILEHNRDWPTRTRKRREYIWISRLNSRTPKGLNEQAGSGPTQQRAPPTKRTDTRRK